MQDGVFSLLAAAGVHVRGGSRGYRPSVSLPGVEAKILKPQNIVEMLAAGSRDLGFAGADWVRELDVDLVEVLDTGLDPVRLVAAAPAGSCATAAAAAGDRRGLRVRAAHAPLDRKHGLDATLVRSYGATEVFPPEDADCIVDNTATGVTLRANGLVVFDEMLTSSTRLYASRRAWADPDKRAAYRAAGVAAWLGARGSHSA